MAGSKENKGGGTHYDYKPWRGVGSFLHWLFAIVPLTDYDEVAGPLLAVPGSHSLSKVLPSDGRVHQVRCASVPSPADLADRLEDPLLRVGDIMLMDGFCWHEAWPNRSAHDRLGLYMKFHAVHSPPAVGPIIHPSVAREKCRKETQDAVFKYHRGDGLYAGTRFQGEAQSGPIEPIPTVDSAILIFERKDGRIFAVRDKACDSWQLPSCLVDEAGQYSSEELKTFHYLDCGNVISGLSSFVKREYGLSVPWMSWIADRLHVEGTKQHLRRVYAFATTGGFEQLDGICGAQEDTSLGSWVTSAELSRDEAGWVRMWQTQTDEDGQPVKRGIGFSQKQLNHSLATHINSGNDLTKESAWVCAEYSNEGFLCLPKGRVKLPNAVTSAQLAS
eukprot:gnl/MRDRNA2_/MRDRNA2_166917_c0_seq1.p1 gnl/MRDRNA2_/MRDRNA2_166917_c0~~gnl/MRDRNA2_/MRDRNA2_166917_c0_seq1.p1  ORF type:complete len:431 (-),score=66.76 gnl/MRDRNA2_/MRDRNA2_166917_c0_seq1:95-1261(-)